MFYASRLFKPPQSPSGSCSCFSARYSGFFLVGSSFATAQLPGKRICRYHQSIVNQIFRSCHLHLIHANTISHRNHNGPTQCHRGYRCPCPAEDGQPHLPCPAPTGGFGCEHPGRSAQYRPQLAVRQVQNRNEYGHEGGKGTAEVVHRAPNWRQYIERSLPRSRGYPCDRPIPQLRQGPPPQHAGPTSGRPAHLGRGNSNRRGDGCLGPGV